jgi:hypothetical protein
MGFLPWLGLAVFVVAIVAGAAVAAVRGLQAWRTLRTFQRRLDTAIAETTRLLDGIEPRVAKATATGARLEDARARLQESTAAASVLFSALGEALGLLQRVLAFVPR